MKLDLTGLIAAPHTPMHDDGSLNLDVITQQAAHLRRNGVVAAFICGTTGEGVSLTSDERRRVAERWRAEAGSVRVLVNVAHDSTAESRALAAHAAQIGADAVATMATSFFRPARQEELIA